MMQHHGYNLSDIENMMSWERSVYISLLINHINEENEKIKLKEASRKKKNR